MYFSLKGERGKEVMKYKNYAELLSAYKSGELTNPLMMDNDDCYVYSDDHVLLFKGDGEMDIIKIMEVAGFMVEEV